MMRAVAAALAVAALSLALALRPRAAAPAPPVESPVDPAKDHFSLSEGAQKHLWEVEQRAFLLGQEAGPRLSKALREGLPGPWEEVLARGATLRIPAGSGVVCSHAPLTISSWSEFEEVAPATFVRWLAEARSRFASVTRSSVHFENLRPLGADLDGRHSGSFSLHLVGIDAGGGPGEWFAQCDYDLAAVPAHPGTDGGWIERIAVVGSWTASAPAPLFADGTARCGIDPTRFADRWAWKRPADIDPVTALATYALDYDGDGHLDLLLFHGRPYLYRGLGDGRFVDATEAAGLPVRLAWTFLGGSVADFDNDGDEDLLLDARLREGAMNVAFENLGDGTFRMLAKEEFAQLRLSVTHGAVADYDGDGLVDLYLANSGVAPAGEERRARWIGDRTLPAGVLLRNRGGWRFEDVTAKAGAGADFRDIFAAHWLDADGDGDPDLLLANHMGENPLLENRGDGTFREHPTAPGFGGFSMGLATGDLDNDGDVDAYFANMSSFAGTRILQNLRPTDYPPGVFDLLRGFVQGNVVLRNDTRAGGPPAFRELADQPAGWAYGPSAADFDGDGLLDLYCPAGYQSVERGEADG